MCRRQLIRLGTLAALLMTASSIGSGELSFAVDGDLKYLDQSYSDRWCSTSPQACVLAFENSCCRAKFNPSHYVDPIQEHYKCLDKAGSSCTASSGGYITCSGTRYALSNCSGQILGIDDCYTQVPNCITNPDS